MSAATPHATPLKVLLFVSALGLALNLGRLQCDGGQTIEAAPAGQRVYPATERPADEGPRDASYSGDDVFDDYFTSDDNQDDATYDDHAPDSGDDFDQDDGWGPDDAGFVPDDPAATG